MFLSFFTLSYILIAVVLCPYLSLLYNSIFEKNHPLKNTSGIYKCNQRQRESKKKKRLKNPVSVFVLVLTRESRVL